MPARIGLTSDEAARRLSTFGPNDIRAEQDASVIALLARQFTSPVVILLIVAAVVSAAVGATLDAFAIAAIVVLNACVGFVQEHKAERALVALRSMTAPRARVIRNGGSQMVAAREVVPGDLLLLEPGDVVAADARLLEAHALTLNEAILTGESVPSAKAIAPHSRPDETLAERRDLVFMGTAVATGTGLGEITATGMSTELGRIASLLAAADVDPTPLQTRLAVVTRSLIYVCLALVAVVAAAGLLRGLDAVVVFMSAVSLAVAAVPEGLPAIVTIALAVGVQRMAARHVLIRRLQSVETLGCATVICTDKTGTLTTGVMDVRDLWGADHERLLFAAAACSDAELADDGRRGVGDPTELAILAAAASRGISRPHIESTRPRVHVWPFDPTLKRMAVERADGVTYIKGALEVVLPLTDAVTEPVALAAAAMAERGLRVLAVATADSSQPGSAELAGLIGIADAPRPEALAAVTAARRAGITTVMITGDHPVTARAIGRELGIPPEMIHARATPEDKLHIVRHWQARGHVVAMTGDGVNDAPALREAHIGIAMGRSGTQVTREASDMILENDDFASIIAAVREGRGIFENIRKTLVYLLTGNASELLVMLAAAMAGAPLPLLPLHLLWINVVTDGLPSLALVMDPPPHDALEHPPRRPDEQILGRPQWTSIALVALLEAAVVLSVFAWALYARPLADARTIAFSAIVFAELFRALAARSSTRVFWATGVFSNLRLLAVIAVSAAMQLAIQHVAAAREVFNIVALAPADTLLCLVAGLVPVSVIEMRKLLGGGGSRGRRPPPPPHITTPRSPAGRTGDTASAPPPCSAAST